MVVRFLAPQASLDLSLGSRARTALKERGALKVRIEVYGILSKPFFRAFSAKVPLKLYPGPAA
jgi:hypothetical protein